MGVDGKRNGSSTIKITAPTVVMAYIIYYEEDISNTQLHALWCKQGHQ